MIDLYLILIYALLSVKYGGRVFYLSTSLILAFIAWVLIKIKPSYMAAKLPNGNTKWGFYKAIAGFALLTQFRYKPYFLWPESFYNYKLAWKNLMEAIFYRG